MKAPDTSVSFPTTSWTAVRDLRGKDDPDAAHRALADLCGAYWYPLYALARRSGCAPHDAEDATQSFLSTAAQGGLFAGADQKIGKFRTFLITAFTRHLGDLRKYAGALKRGGGATVVPLDFTMGEELYVAERPGASTPELLFDRAWARAILDRSMALLGSDETAAGRGESFAVLKAQIAPDGAGDSGHVELAASLGSTPVAARQALSRLRARFREILRREIASTLCDPDTARIEAELAALRAALRHA